MSPRSSEAKEEKSIEKTKPVVVVRAPTLGKKFSYAVYCSSSINLDDNRILVDECFGDFLFHYQQAIFHAVLTAFVTLYEIPSSTIDLCDIYVRDTVSLIPDKKILLHAYNDFALDLIPKLNLDYKQHHVASEYLEGGNCFYSKNKKSFLFGTYSSEENPALKEISVVTDFFAKHDITASPLTLNSAISKKIRKGYYYHLDCFMHILPDDRVLILHQHILAPESYEQLLTIFGKENVINLAYPGYIDSPFMFNIVVVETSPAYSLICPLMPEVIATQLRDLHFTVITPSAICSDSLRYNDGFDIDLATHVVADLHSQGFAKATVTNLTYELPHNHLGYRYFNTEAVGIKFFANKKIPPKQQALTFCPSDGAPETGGPHCTTLEIPRTGSGNRLQITGGSPHEESVSTIKRPSSFFN